VRAVSGDNVFSVILLYAEHKVRTCSTANGNLHWSQFGKRRWKIKAGSWL